MCSARMDQDFILEAFRRGAGMVLVSGCHPQDCHYITGQRVGATRAERLQKTLENMGMTPGRFRVEWISAAEGDKYARVINELQKALMTSSRKDERRDRKTSSTKWKNAPGACMTSQGVTKQSNSPEI